MGIEKHEHASKGYQPQPPSITISHQPYQTTAREPSSITSQDAQLGETIQQILFLRRPYHQGAAQCKQFPVLKQRSLGVWTGLVLLRG